MMGLQRTNNAGEKFKHKAGDMKGTKDSRKGGKAGGKVEKKGTRN